MLKIIIKKKYNRKRKEFWISFIIHVYFERKLSTQFLDETNSDRHLKNRRHNIWNKSVRALHMNIVNNINYQPSMRENEKKIIEPISRHDKNAHLFSLIDHCHYTSYISIVWKDDNANNGNQQYPIFKIHIFQNLTILAAYFLDRNIVLNHVLFNAFLSNFGTFDRENILYQSYDLMKPHLYMPIPMYILFSSICSKV